jgi:hypothetical protein
MSHTMKAVAVLFGAISLLLSLSACGSDEAVRNDGIAELTSRGFEEVRFVKTGQFDNSAMMFTAQVGTCRLDIVRRHDGEFRYQDMPRLSEAERAALSDLPGGLPTSTVNASFIEAYSFNLGLGYCTPNGTK